MNGLASYRSLQNSNARCADFITMAEQELSAFFNVVTQLFGSEQAELAAEDWLCELIEIDSLPTSTGEWRLFTARASGRFACRVNALSRSTEFTNA